MLVYETGRYRFCELECARQEASQKITRLLDIFTTTEDQNEKQVLAYVLRIGGGYICEIKRQRDTSSIAGPGHYRNLMRLHLDALWWLDALKTCDGSPRGVQMMIALLQDAAEFFKVTVNEELQASLQADAEQEKTYVMLNEAEMVGEMNS